MERMNALDAGMFFAETERAPLNIASITVLEGPPPAYDDLVDTIRARMPRLPRYRQRVRTVPFNLGLPVWIDDPDFRLSHHVRHTALPRPGGRRELGSLVGRIMSQRLDLSRPLWEMWMVEGLAHGRWAVISKVHHCVVDGVGASDLIGEIFDLEARPPEPRRIPEVKSEPPPSALALTLDGLGQAAVRPVRAIARLALRPSPSRAFGTLREVRDFTEGLPHTVEQITHHGVASLSGPAGRHRRWSWLEVDLDEVKAIRVALGGTVNDVVLAAVTHGFRALLSARGELTDQTLVRSLVPVSVRGSDEQGDLGNHVSALIVTLPCGEPDPARRLEVLRTEMDTHKHTHQAVSADAVVRLAGSAPTMLSPATRVIMSALTPMFQTVTTNVPGPQFPLYALGRKVVALYPYVPLAAGAGISVGVFSYLGRLYFGITGDFDTVPDIETLTAGIEAGFSELTDLAAPAETEGAAR
ncbi:wax ester/triacylglycerol synthase family O-acyltransferase [Spirillospora sp. NPDC048911]|uniref:WS/DGAT/MGAT family O-acyltransferase n=1 Tax=Spirillospora sp. NPDC048911 TaxID=3364527 RepID=UPI00371BB150